jgi:carboxypeptidase Q
MKRTRKGQMEHVDAMRAGSMRAALALFCSLLLPGNVLVYAQPGSPADVSPGTRDAIRQMAGDTIVNGRAYAYDNYLADNIGPRLTGSENYTRAAEWAVQEFHLLGLSRVHTEEWTMPATWEPETAATGRILAPIGRQLHIYSMGWSPSTPPGGVEGEVFYVPSMEIAGLDRQKPQLAGTIALIDDASFSAAQSIDKMFPALDHLRSLGVRALLVAGGSNGTEVMDTRNISGTIDPLPEAQIGMEDVLLIKRLLGQGSVRVHFSFANQVRQKVQVANVVAEIKGSESPDQVVIVGAHLDSWQPGTGAQDNGTGVAMVLEAARAMMAVHRPPRRTVRFVLFGGEEQGLLGSVAYVREHKAELEKLDVVLVTDSGSEPAKGWCLMGREDEKASIAALKPLLNGLGADETTSNTDFIFQTDHAPFDVQGVPSLVLWTAMDKYEQLHHKASDTFESVVQKDLTQDAAVVAITAYALADSQQPFAPHLSPAQVQEMFRSAGHLEEYDYLRTSGILP